MIYLLKLIQFKFRLLFLLPAAFAIWQMNLNANIVQWIAKRTRLKREVAENIKLVLPKVDANKTADRLIENTSHSIFELLAIPYFKTKHFHSVVRWQGNQHVKPGSIILTMHAGNYEIIPMAMAHLGFRMNTVLRATDDPLFKIVNNSRAHGGVNLINTLEKDMYKESLKALEKGESIFLLADTGALESRHTSFDFLGKKVPVATGWLTLAQRAGCPVIPTLARRESGKNVITFFEPVTITKENREAMMQKVGKTFEDFIKQYPESWALFLNTYETKRMMGL